MSLRINHNIAAINGARNLAMNDARVSKSLERLSTGLRINHGGDDAAGLILSEQFRNQIAGLNQALKNGEIATAMIQTTEGAMDELSNLLIKGKELAIHSLNAGTNDQNALIADQTELDNVVDSINRIVTNTTFGSKMLLDGSLSSAKSNNVSVASVTMGKQYATDVASSLVTKGFASLNVTIGATRRTETIAGGDATLMTGANIATMSGGETFQKSFVVTVKGVQLSVASGTSKNSFVAQLNAIGKTAGFVASMSGAGGTGAITLTNAAYGAVASLQFAFVSGYSGASTIVASTLVAGVDATATLINYTGTFVGGTAISGGANTQALVVGTVGDGNRLVFSGYVIQLAAGTITGFYTAAIDTNSSAATFQIGGNFGASASVELNSMAGSVLGAGVSSVFSSVDQIKGGSLIAGNAGEVMKVLAAAIDTVTVARGKLGAFQANTLDSAMAANANTAENMTASESVLRDVDFAAESAEFTKNNILVQSATAMLAQANQLPQNVLQLLG